MYKGGKDETYTLLTYISTYLVQKDNNDISFCIAPFARGYKVLLLIIMVSGKLSQSFHFRHLRVLLAKCTPYQHLDCNIFHD